MSLTGLLEREAGREAQLEEGEKKCWRVDEEIDHMKVTMYLTAGVGGPLPCRPVTATMIDGAVSSS